MSKNNIITIEKVDEQTILPNTDEQIQFQLPVFQLVQTNNTEKNTLKGETNFDFTRKKCGRRNKHHKIFKSEEKGHIPDIFSNDNIKKRIKALYNKYIIKLLNNKVRKI